MLYEGGHYTDNATSSFGVSRQYAEGQGRPIIYQDQPNGPNLAPAAPPKDADFQQWCGWFCPKSMDNPKRVGTPLEMDLWVYPEHPPGAVIKTGGMWVFRHRFQLTDRQSSAPPE